METVEGRGIQCGNEVYFNYVDGEVVMTTYRDVPGVRMDRRDPNVIKTFSIEQWGKINEFLRETLDDVEGVFSDGDENEGEVFEPADSAEAEPTSLSANISAKEVKLPKMGDGELVLPGKVIPAMTKQELEDNKENEDG